MVATSHENQLFIPWGFPLPPHNLGRTAVWGFLIYMERGNHPGQKSLQSAEAALCLQRLRHKAPKWLMFLTHIFLADVITEENKKRKWFKKKLLEIYVCIFTTRHETTETNFLAGFRIIKSTITNSDASVAMLISCHKTRYYAFLESYNTCSTWKKTTHEKFIT